MVGREREASRYQAGGETSVAARSAISYHTWRLINAREATIMDRQFNANVHEGHASAIDPMLVDEIVVQS
jgi:hypothetical protein